MWRGGGGGGGGAREALKLQGAYAVSFDTFGITKSKVLFTSRFILIPHLPSGKVWSCKESCNKLELLETASLKRSGYKSTVKLHRMSSLLLSR